MIHIRWISGIVPSLVSLVSMVSYVYSIPIVVVGNIRDEHGCLVSGGYQWCEDTQECQRAWEIPCIDYLLQ